MNTAQPLAAWNVFDEQFPEEGSSEEKLWFTLKYAVLAPSNRNTQPWRFRVHGNEIELYADFRRSLPVVDPNNRELMIGCGAALFHIQTALDYFGYGSHIEMLPDPGTPELLVRLRMGFKEPSHAEEVLLFHAITKRRTNRLPFRPEPVPEELLWALEASARKEGAWLHVLRDDAARYALADLVVDADEAQWSSHRFRRELASWMSPNGSIRRDGIPGYAFGFGNLRSYAAPFVVRTIASKKVQELKDRELAIHSPALAVLGTDRDEPREWLAAGQALARVLLRARIEDLWASFLNQPVEVADLRPTISQIIDQPGFPQLILRLGFGADPKPTPRRSVESVLLHQSPHAPAP